MHDPVVQSRRYLAELAKFKLYPPGSFFVALKQLLDDFSHHNIDAACAMVETVGRYDASMCGQVASMCVCVVTCVGRGTTQACVGRWQACVGRWQACVQASI